MGATSRTAESQEWADAIDKLRYIGKGRNKERLGENYISSSSIEFPFVNHNSNLIYIYLSKAE
jgi:hypothetical protein